MAQPLARVHLYSADLGYDEPVGNIKYVYIFSFVAILILIIACINYMNLATARSSRRSKETGMRKIAGAQRSMLIRQFLDEKMRQYYSGEKRIGMLARTFALLTIIIAALGLLGLSSFLTQTRTREIGIRKISGASANNIVLMFAREFSIWIILANLIAAPVTLTLMNKWLQAFPYKTQIHFTIFLSGLIISLAIALLTVCLRVFQAASINPSQAVRHS